MQYLRQWMADLCEREGGAAKQIFNSQNWTGFILLRQYKL